MFLLKHFGKSIQVDPKVMQAILRERFDKPTLEIVVMLDGCNVSNGFPTGYIGCKIGAPEDPLADRA